MAKALCSGENTWPLPDLCADIGFKSVEDFQRQTSGRIHFIRPREIFMDGDGQMRLSLDGLRKLHDACMGLPNGMEIRKTIRNMGVDFSPMDSAPPLGRPLMLRKSGPMKPTRDDAIAKLQSEIDRFSTQVNLARTQNGMTKEVILAQAELLKMRRLMTELQMERKQERAAENQDNQTRRERLFVDSAKELLPATTIRMIWDAVEQRLSQETNP